MFIHSDLPDLREKIQELQSALFFNQSSSLLKITTSVVSVVKVDEVGQIWFVMPKPRQALHEFDREFPAKMEFFRKGKPFFLHITGKAFIICDPEDINNLVDEEIKSLATEDRVLIKVVMARADYFESTGGATHVGWWKEVRNQLHSWLFNTRPGYKPYQLEPPLVALRPVA